MARHIRRWLPHWPLWMLLGLVALGLLRQASHSSRPDESLPVEGIPYRVIRAVDGDTLLLETGQRVRLIGVDTPETRHPDRPPEPGGAEAAEFTQQSVGGRMVVLHYDRERLDVYRRLLAYVTIEGRLLNEELIRAGHSRAMTSFPYRSDMQRRFRQAESEARAAGRGVWALPAVEGNGR